MNRDELAKVVEREVAAVRVFDMHTHLYGAEFGGMLLSGIDELLTYHYLVSEALIAAPLPYDRFWSMPKPKQAEHVWDALFVRNSPVSEAARGVVTILNALGLDPRKSSLRDIRRYFDSKTLDERIDTVFRLVNLEAVVMTNDPFDDVERTAWRTLGRRDPRFLAALRIDPLVNTPALALPKIKAMGYKVTRTPDAKTLTQIRRFLAAEADRISPLYLAASVSPAFRFPDKFTGGVILEKVVLPFAKDRGLPVALMIGVKRQVNPELRLAGDGVGRADLASVEELCRRYPDVRFLVTCLSLENQHELCVIARKFPNLMLFGCWWFVNTMSSIAEITARRIELLGLHFVPQHSDCRVLEQLIYKWSHSKRIIADVLTRYYAELAASGWPPADAEIRRDVAALFSTNFKTFANVT